MDNLGELGSTMLNRLMSLVVLKCLKCLKQPGVTGKAVKYRGKPGRRRQRPCLHRDKMCAMKTPLVCPDVRPVEPRRRTVASQFAPEVTGIGTV